MNYWKAADHKFGSGKIHVLDDCLQKTICGESLANIKGRQVQADGHNCARCSRSLEARSKREKWQEEAHQRQVERAALDAEWQAWYARYLESPAWRRRRALVLKRANGLCEGCLVKPAVQVHHTTYRNAGDELLWELRAVCMDCHEKCHADRSAS